MLWLVHLTTVSRRRGRMRGWLSFGWPNQTVLVWEQMDTRRTPLGRKPVKIPMQNLASVSLPQEMSTRMATKTLLLARRITTFIKVAEFMYIMAPRVAFPLLPIGRLEVG